MARTTVPAVQGILGDNWDCSTDLQQFIDTASVVVDRVLDCANKRAASLGAFAPTTAELELMERWLAAHFYAQFDQLYSAKTTGKSSATFQGQTTMSIESTRYGQSAINLDWSGCLSALSKRQFARGFWMGTNVGTACVFRAWPPACNAQGWGM